MISVTGATGHIGNVLVRELLQRGETVQAIIPPLENTSSMEGLQITRTEADIRDVRSLIEAFEGSTVVYHLAGLVSISSGNNESLYKINVGGTRNVVEACLRCGITRLVYTSSIHAIASPPHGTAIDETFPFDPDKAMGEYDKSKAQATLDVLDALDQGLDAVVVCPTGVIGPYDYRLSEMGKLFMDVASGRLRAYIDGAYDFVDVRDVAIGHILSCERGRTGESYILSGERISIIDLISMIEEISGVKTRRVKIPVWLAMVAATFTPPYYRLTNTRPRFTKYSIHTLASNSVISNSKSCHEIGYSARPIRDSVVDTIEWFKDAGRLKS
ncbi:MAG: SDR family oxidoreductase [Chloroflexota bacterium]|nr:SDR family oxidoreductase [Chloroflexota bacterium]